MKAFLLKAQAAWRLGPQSLYRFLSYRVGVETGLNPARRVCTLSPQEPFFRQSESTWTGTSSPALWTDEAQYFGWFRVPLHGKPPDWHLNPFSGTRVSDPDRPWWKIADFDAALGDIKAVWEASRFEWVWAHALQSQGGDGTAIDRLNSWLADWLQHNPPYLGPNWKCGQEASIRVIHLLMATMLLGQEDNPCEGLPVLIRLHLLRIGPTVQYAIAQNNNHGTSEAAALFMGGSWLGKLTGDRQAIGWSNMGRGWLEDRARQLIAEDGSFSQYSVNYHRLLLDTLSIVEIWRRKVGEAPFSSAFTQRCRLATEWLSAFIDPESGDAPNLGANDGARLLPITTTGYRDYRPSVQLGAALFLERAAYPEGPWNGGLRMLNVPVPKDRIVPRGSQLYAQGGYARLSCGNARVFVRYPRFRFRPGHADALHIDLWLGRENMLRDGGSYSYAAGSPWQEYFRGCASHNTVQFDDRDQMPRLGRFLYGAWLRTAELELTQQGEQATSLLAAYRDWMGATHRRKVLLEPSRLLVHDQVRGFRRKAVLRWRFAPGEWHFVDGAWTQGRFTVFVRAEMPILRMELVEGWESRYYLKRDPIPVLEVEVEQAGYLHSEFTWSSTPDTGSRMPS